MKNKVQFQLEYVVKSSLSILYDFVSSSLGLQEWFADDVVIKDGDRYFFTWQGSLEVAKVIGKEQDKYIRFKWENSTNDDEFFEFKVAKTEISNQTILTITDFAYEDEMKEQKMLIDHQVQKMLYRLGGGG